MSRLTFPLITTPVVVALSLGALSTSLAACGGGGATTAIQTQTTGQQLIDLKSALDAGVITQREYDTKRREILRHN
jgi:hypothetical protein